MWINPKYADRYEQPAPPQETGERLATFPRGDGAELRVSLAEYQGRAYLALRVWERDRDGAWWPVKGKGVSVRMAEAPELARVLATVQAPAQQQQPRHGDDGHRPDPGDRTTYRERGRPGRPPWDSETLPKPDARPFDECGGE